MAHWTVRRAAGAGFSGAAHIRGVTVTLRPATAADIDPLVAIARRSWLSAFAAHAPAALVEWWRAADREPAWYALYWPDMLVAEADGTLAGLVQPRADEVNGLWVDPAWQGRGLGRLLLGAAESRIAAQGHRRVWLTCSGFNQRAAGFYRTCGYEVEREESKEHPSGIVEPVLTFARAVPRNLEPVA